MIFNYEMKRDYEINEINEINENPIFFVYFVHFVYFVISLHLIVELLPICSYSSHLSSLIIYR